MRVLMVDDQEGWLGFTVRRLERLRYTVAAASTFERALAEIAAAPFDAGVFDVNLMPGFGFDLVRLQVGADFRFSPRLAVSPVIGMDVTTFVRTVDEWDYDQRIADKRLSVFFFAGLGGRFDFGGADVQPR